MSTREVLSRWQERETAWCLRWNLAARRPRVARAFATVSRLGDGALWYGVMAAFALVGGVEGRQTAVRMAIAGVATTLFYSWVKRVTGPVRPCELHAELEVPVAPLDRFSFPSGHTMHAVCFTVLATAAVPWLGIVLIPFAMLVMASRIVLGLHYPSDVAVGALVGAVAAVVACG